MAACALQSTACVISQKVAVFLPMPALPCASELTVGPHLMAPAAGPRVEHRGRACLVPNRVWGLISAVISSCVKSARYIRKPVVMMKRAASSLARSVSTLRLSRRCSQSAGRTRRLRIDEASMQSHEDTLWREVERIVSEGVTAAEVFLVSCFKSTPSLNQLEAAQLVVLDSILFEPRLC
jgi:hypothetical protein